MRKLRLALLGLCAAVAAPCADLPRPAPALEFISHEGARINLAGYRGKVVIVEFLLTYCSTCQESARTLSKLQSEYGPKGFQALGVATNDNAALGMREFLQKGAVNFPVGIRKHDYAVEFLQWPAVVRMTMPQIAIIDRRGQIREQHNPMEYAWWGQKEKNLRALIEKLLAEGRGAAPNKPAATSN
jgi:peroxiredoxin